MKGRDQEKYNSSESNVLQFATRRMHIHIYIYMYTLLYRWVLNCQVSVPEDDDDFFPETFYENISSFTKAFIFFKIVFVNSIDVVIYYHSMLIHCVLERIAQYLHKKDTPIQWQAGYVIKPGEKQPHALLHTHEVMSGVWKIERGKIFALNCFFCGPVIRSSNVHAWENSYCALAQAERKCYNNDLTGLAVLKGVRNQSAYRNVLESKV